MGEKGNRRAAQYVRWYLLGKHELGQTTKGCRHSPRMQKNVPFSLFLIIESNCRQVGGKMGVRSRVYCGKQSAPAAAKKPAALAEPEATTTGATDLTKK